MTKEEEWGMDPKKISTNKGADVLMTVYSRGSHKDLLLLKRHLEADFGCCTKEVAPEFNRLYVVTQEKNVAIILSDPSVDFAMWRSLDQKGGSDDGPLARKNPVA